MNIPQKLKIGGHWIKVDCSKELKDDVGTFSSANNTISICKTLAQSQKECTLIHEMMHVMNSGWEINNERHAFMDSIAEQFYQVLVDNKLLK